MSDEKVRQRVNISKLMHVIKLFNLVQTFLSQSKTQVINRIRFCVFIDLSRKSSTSKRQGVKQPLQAFQNGSLWAPLIFMYFLVLKRQLMFTYQSYFINQQKQFHLTIVQDNHHYKRTILYVSRLQHFFVPCCQKCNIIRYIYRTL